LSTVNSSSTSTQTNTSTAAMNTSANLMDALSSLDSLKQQQTFTKLTSSLLGSPVPNPQLIAGNSLALSNNTKSNNNNQSFKCTICGYKGNTLRGMKTHVRVHGDQLQGAQEESFIIPLSDEC